MKKTGFKVEGIVLKRTNYKEADRLVTIYTRTHGKLTVIAKGVRKPASKLKGGLEIASHAWFYVVPFHSHFILTQLEVIKSFSGLSQTLGQMTKAQQMLEIINSLTVPDEPNEVVFDEFLNSLQHIESEGGHKLEILKYIHAILYSLGFAAREDGEELRLQYLIEGLIERPLRSKKFLTPVYIRV